MPARWYDLVQRIHANKPIVRILDLGCGAGNFASLRQPGQFWLGIDSEPQCVGSDEVRGRYDAVLELDARLIDWAQLGPFDLVICDGFFDALSQTEVAAVVSAALSWSRLVLAVFHSDQTGEGSSSESQASRPGTDWISTLPGFCVAASENLHWALLVRESETSARVDRPTREEERERRLCFDADRETLRQRPNDIALMRRFSQRWSSVFPEATAKAIDQTCGAEGESPIDLIMKLRVRATLSETFGRKTASSPAGLQDLHFQFAGPEIAMARRLAEEFVSRKPGSAGGLLLLAEAYLAEGDLERAGAAFSKFKSLGLKDYTASTVDFSAEFHAHLSHDAHSIIAHSLPEVTVVADEDAAASQIIFTACDPPYLEAYGWPMIASLARHSDPEITLALHLFDASTPHIADVRSRLDRLFPRYILTTEQTGMTRERPDRARAYYHAIRFVRFHQLLSVRPGAAGWSLDSDLLFNRAPRPLFDSLRPNGIGLWLLPGRFEVHSQIAAGLLGVGGEIQAREFLARVAAYLATHHQRDALTWGIDQVALFAVASRMRTETALPAVTPVTASTYDGTFSRNASIWPGKCEPESDDYDRYAAFRAGLDACVLSTRHR